VISASPSIADGCVPDPSSPPRRENRPAQTAERIDRLANAATDAGDQLNQASMQLALDRSVNRGKRLLYRRRRVRLTAANRINQEQLLLNADRERLSRAERVCRDDRPNSGFNSPSRVGGRTPRTQSAAGVFAHTTSQRPRNSVRAVRADFRFAGSRVYSSGGIRHLNRCRSILRTERAPTPESLDRRGPVSSRPRTPRRSFVVGRTTSSEAVLNRESLSSIRKPAGALSTRRVQALAASFRLGSS
jgi:hypothetical protein